MPAFLNFLSQKSIWQSQASKMWHTEPFYRLFILTLKNVRLWIHL